jgi:hypothetical protein
MDLLRDWAPFRPPIYIMKYLLRKWSVGFGWLSIFSESAWIHGDVIHTLW